jgi:hypothetical protein
MKQPPSATEAQQALRAHAAAKGAEIHARYGPRIGWAELERILADRRCVRHPCAVEFDATPLGPGEFATPLPRGEHPRDGFVIHVHPFFQDQRDRVPYLVFYQLVVVNYGNLADATLAELFGARALGVSVDEYYRAVCALADALPR